MRSITDHRLNGLNDAIEINAIGDPGPGGANHNYSVVLSPPGRPSFHVGQLVFQNGPISKPEDMNGITNEALLAVLIDRMRGFQYGRRPDGTFDEAQRGQFACRENAIALTHLEDALHWLQHRTRARLQRGVEGTLKP
jgi:hypothetical protein